LRFSLNGLLIYLVVGFTAGGIAYFGNFIGRKVGRSRMSVLGLRPRHTSHLITTLTGSAIALATLTFFALTSDSVHDVITGIDQQKIVLAGLRDEVARIRQDINQGRIVWQVGEPILLWTANPADSSRTIKNELLSALSTANDLSIAKNDKIASQQNGSPLRADTQLVEFDDSKLESIVHEIQAKGQVTGIRVVSQRNCLYQQQVEVNLELQPVRLVFRAGETVARKVVQETSPGQFLKEWYGFLALMRQNALRSGMEEINNSLGGGLTDEDFSHLIEEIARYHGRGELAAIAKRDLYQSMPLDVRVEMRAAPSTVAQSTSVQGAGKP
jgi:uncharacterized protein (DUF3084 family)